MLDSAREDVAVWLLDVFVVVLYCLSFLKAMFLIPGDGVGVFDPHVQEDFINLWLFGSHIDSILKKLLSYIRK